VRAGPEIHHEADHLVAFQRGEHALRGALRREDVHVLVLAVRDEEVHEALVLELVRDDRERDVLRDARTSELEVAEVRRYEDESLAAVASGLQVAERGRVDLHHALQVVRMQRRETHDLGEVLREVPEAAPGDPGDLGIVRPTAQHDGEVALGDLASRTPREVRDLSAEHGGGVDEAGG
jgi:hypothetical protein